MKREFYLQDDRSNKFWTIELQGTECVTTHGRVGAAPRETREQFPDEAHAKKDFDKQIAAKTAKGYREGIAPAYAKPDWSSMIMSEETFWRIIALFNWKRTGDDDAVIEPAVAALAQMPILEIQRFEEILAEKLFALDTQQHALQIGEYAYVPGQYFSGDLFLYARCVVVANGRAYFDEVVADPGKMPKDMDFEPLLFVGSTAFERNTGSEFDYATRVSYESFSNRAAWPDLREPE